MRKRFIVLIAALVCAADRVVKMLLGEVSGEWIPGFLRLTPAKNTGISFGMFEGGNAVMIVLTAALIVGGVWYLRRLTLSGLAPVALALMLGGAVGNLVDRVLYGHVIDMLEFEFVEFFIFNVADAAVVCGAVLCCLSLLFRADDWRKA